MTSMTSMVWRDVLGRLTQGGFEARFLPVLLFVSQGPLSGRSARRSFCIGSHSCK